MSIIYFRVGDVTGGKGNFLFFSVVAKGLRVFFSSVQVLACQPFQADQVSLG